MSALTLRTAGWDKGRVGSRDTFRDWKPYRAVVDNGLYSSQVVGVEASGSLLWIRNETFEGAGA